MAAQENVLEHAGLAISALKPELEKHFLSIVLHGAMQSTLKVRDTPPKIGTDRLFLFRVSFA